MGLIWLESFETPSNNDKQSASGTYAYSTSARSAITPRTGSRKGTSSNEVRLGTADQDDLLIVGCAFQVPAGGAAELDLFTLAGDAGATTHLTVRISRTGPGSPFTIKVYRGTSGGTLLGTSSSFVERAAGTWVHFAVKARLHDSTGSVVIQYDETEILNLSGIDTKNAGTASVFDHVIVSASYAAVDDEYIANEQGSINTDFLGAIRVEVLTPNGNGNASQGVGSDGNSTDNYLLVDDPPITPDLADYVDFATTGDKDTYAHTDSALPTGNSVKGLMVWARAEKTDAGARSLISVLRMGGSESDGGAPALTNGSFFLLGDIFQTKPGGGSMLVSDVNAMEAGTKAGA